MIAGLIHDKASGLRLVYRRLTSSRAGRVGVAVVFVALFGFIGYGIQAALHAATPTAAFEVESGTASGGSVVSDTSASGGSAIKFVASPANNSDNPSSDAGSHLPISYNVGSLTGTVIYVSPTGSDSGSGAVGSPYATLAKAISVAPSGATIVLRGGTYRQGGITVNKTLKVIAYPGETPVFNGATAVSGGWTVSGNMSYRPYTPIPVTSGSGIDFAACVNQTSSCVGQYPDQVWIGSSQLEQVSSQGAVVDGKFYVDHTNNRIYLDTTDVNKGNIELSGQRTFANVTAPNVNLKGFKIIRYSNTASDSGILKASGTADNSLFEELYISDAAFITVNFYPNGTTDLNQNSTLKDSTVTYSNWMGVSALATNNFTLDHDYISNMNQFNEFTSSPQSGALKTSRTWYTKVLNSKVVNNNSQGIWFDQSNYKAEVANNDIENNNGSGLFYEISDYIYIVNNYIKATGGSRAVKLAAASDLYMVNNTVIGGADPVGVYVDARSLPGCSDPASGIQCGPYSSVVDNYHPHQATMTWFPSINLFVDNIFAYPTATGYCGTTTALCVTRTNATATVDITTIIHHADPAHNVPQTFIDGNVYANGSGNIVNLKQLGNYTTTSAFASAVAGAPTNIGGFETHGLAGNNYVNSDGSPTSALATKHSSAYPVPSDAIINKYITAGNKHYGVSWQ